MRLSVQGSWQKAVGNEKFRPVETEKVLRGKGFGFLVYLKFGIYTFNIIS